MIKSVSIDGKNYGPDQLFLISGPCVIEDEKIMFETAEQLKLVSEKLDIPVIYKSSFMKDNRSSRYDLISLHERERNSLLT